MASKQKHSIEELVEQWAKEQLKGIKLYAKNDFINPQIEKALKTAPSKKGGKGPNYPDIKFILNTPDGDLPVMIEVKGTKGALIKIDEETGLPDNVTKKGEPNFTNIAKYAVNGAVHYANAIVRHTTYKEVLAIGVNGYKDEADEIVYEVSAWYLSRKNLFVPKEMGHYNDLSFLLKKYRQTLLKQIANIDLTEEELEQQKSNLEDDIERKLKELNQKMQDELRIVVNQRVQLVTGLIMAGLGVKNDDGAYKVHPLQEDELRGDKDSENNDGAVIISKVKSYLKDKSLPSEKIEMIVDILKVVFIGSGLEKPDNGESKLKTLYRDIKSDIIPFLTGELHNLDFTGRLFNVLNAWVSVPDGDKNDVVLTPRSVTELMAKLCLVDKNSYVWDFATGSAGFLISAMHLMIADANKITDPEERAEKILHIKTEQLLGIEKLADIYLLAVLNMILMKDGSANIIHGNSLTEFKGNYEQGEMKGKPFPADVFLLNPPYSAPGKGFVFVKRALQMMTHKGMAAVLIQENAGSGNGLPYTKEILKENTLVASIKMPIDLFIGKSSVETAIYVFKVGAPHTRKAVVRFIDFSNDGYSRTNRRHSSQSVNLRDTNNARERYAEVVSLVQYGKGVNNENLKYYSSSFIEDHITLNGNDWTYGQHKKIETTPTEEDFYKIVKEYLAWRVSGVIKQDEGKVGRPALERRNPEGGYKYFKIGDLFNIQKGKRLTKANMIPGEINFIGATSANNGLTAKIGNVGHIHPAGTITVTYNGSVGEAFYQREPFWASDDVNVLYPKFPINELIALYFLAPFIRKGKSYGYSYKWTKDKMKKDKILLPVTLEGKIDFDFIEKQMRELEENRINELIAERKYEIEMYRKVLDKQSMEIVKTEIMESKTNYSEEEEPELLMAAEPFNRYKWEGFDQSINDFFGGNQTILIGCYKGKDYQEWIHSYNMYNIRLGKTKGSMEGNRELFESTSLLVLYELGKPDKLSAYKITGHHEISKDELIKLDYPNKKPRKSYMAFDIVPLERDLPFLVEHHLIERLIEIDSNNAKGTPIFIEP